ncbi:MAG: hypothetical protein ACFFCT_14995 [Candidatus Odinarchaeota archaeon]
MELFWQEIQTNISPIIEPIEGDDQSLVTFLKRAEGIVGALCNIVLIEVLFNRAALLVTHDSAFSPEVKSNSGKNL